ncbi:MAG: winged helix-turn-helix domain-containing protein [Pyrinomonadaceae bacterium]|nr:winged helix-turn-helix domain-containing protein [Pyrinomonadaceae bacterium]
MKPQQTQDFYHFGAFRLEAAERRLWCFNEPVSLTPKEFELLFYFVEHAGRVAKKSDLLEAVWTDTFIEETTLARNVSWLRKKLAECGADGEQFIETVPKIGYRFAAEVSRSAQNEDALIVEEQIVQHFRGKETITIDDAAAINEADETGNEEWENINPFSQKFPSSRRSLFALTFLFIGIAFAALAGSGYSLYQNYSKTDAQITDLNINAKVPIENITVDATSEKPQIKVGSIVNLRNQYSDEAGYLDAWGVVRNKPEFSQVPTETMFVSTHPNPNRDNGSGSWEIVSATGKRNGETLVFGDKIHLRNRHPNSDYLDNCGWIMDMPVFKSVLNIEKFAVFTTNSKDRDDGTGTWIVKSDAESDGSPVLEGDGISLENGFPGGGYLNTAGRVSDIPAFNDYDGSLLVFIHASSTSRRPNSGIWIISGSKAALK